MELIPDNLDDLSADDKRALLARLQTEQTEQGTTFPLSPAQRRLWFLSQLEASKAAYNSIVAWRLKGPLQIPVLKQSLNEIVLRQQLLRTRFPVRDGQAVQQVAVSVDLPLRVVDTAAETTGNADADIQAWLAIEIQQEFDLENSFPVRFSLLQLGPQDHVLVIVMHHIVSDGWSMNVFSRELGELYSAFLQAQPSPLAPLTIQYADYGVWQLRELGGPQLQTQLDYWKQHLRHSPTLLQLPTDRPRPAVETFAGARHSVSFSQSLLQGLKTLSQTGQATLFMTLLAAFNLLLYRYTDQDDIVVGCPMAGRNRSDVEGLIGFFVNTLALRLDLSGQPTFRELIARVREVALGAYAHQDLPFERLVEELHPDRDTSHNPVFQVMFGLQNMPTETLNLAQLEVVPVEVPWHSAKVDLTLQLEETVTGIEGVIEYNTDLFDADTIERLYHHLHVLLNEIVTDPDQPISQLSLLTTSEHEQLLIEWNRTATQYPRDQTVHALFEQQVSETPDSIAVEFEGKTLSYAELNKRANQLAHYLQARGVGPDVMVGLFMERSREMVVGLLGILKAGGAYIPLDPGFPVERLNFMLKDSGANVLLSRANLPTGLVTPDTRAICLKRNAQTIAAQSDKNIVAIPGSDDLAYVIYTSGSTGKPKGVLISHRALVNFLHSMAREPGLNEQDILLAVSTLSFDIAGMELYLPLIRGARLVLASREQAADGLALANLLSENGVTVIQATPATWRLLLASGWKGSSTLKVLCGGEALPRDLASALLRRCAELWNMYGPTETTIWSTKYRVTEVSGPIPIGRPIDNTSIYILDGNLNPVPIGIYGNLYIGGDGLARGYFNRPELTAEKFIADPFSNETNARLYKTGDLARYRADGNIDYLGRIDYQIKLRGFRIELGEIEAVLANNQAVRDAVVMLREDTPDDKRLVAYVLAEQDSPLTLDTLRQHIRSTLPEYMVPSAFVFLEALPVTPNGKVDRKALPVPDDVRASLKAEYTPPRTALEEQLGRIWSEVLKMDRFGIHDNFFDLGGHSLMATLMVSRVRERMNVELSLSEIFSHPTLAELAPVIAALSHENLGGEETAILPVARDGDLPLSFAQERLWFLDQLEVGNPFYNMPLSIRLKGELSVVALVHSLNSIVRRHQTLRTHFVNRQGGPVQEIDEQFKFELVHEDISGIKVEERETELQRRVKDEALQLFDLEQAPPVRGKLLRISEHDHVLLLTMHHIISDGWSVGVLFRELGACYAAFSRGQQPELLELPVQYVDFACWQRDWLTGAVLEAQLNYWKECLVDLPALALPTDRPRPPVQSFRGALLTRALSEELTNKLKILSQQESASLFMLLLAGFTVLLQRYSGQEDIVVGSPIANRNRSELEGLIGFFVNSLVMRTDVSGNPSFKELVRRVKDIALGSYEHQDLPFEKLVMELQPERDPSRNPLFQVMFTLQSEPLASFELEGLTIRAASNEIRTTRFDLEIHVWERSRSLAVRLIYSKDLFDAATIERLLGHYQTLLEGIVADPDQRISELAILSEQERQQFVEWNQTTTDYPREQTVPALFEAQVTRTPEAVAVEYDSELLSYSELNERANRLAHYLRQLGVGPEVRVGLFMERSLEMIVGLLGIVKAGGAYVPLDLDYPSSRIAFMLEDAQVPVLLSTSKLNQRLPDFAGELVCLDTDWVKIEKESADNPTPNATAASLAYVIYTSGSTGTPKGVEIPHRAINRLVCNTDYYQVDATDRIAQASNVSFDAATFEIWGALLNGAQLIGIDKEVLLNSKSLAAFLEAQRISAMFITTAVFNQIAREVPGAFSGLKGLMFGGEAVDCNAVRQVLTNRPPKRLLHVYGPTESTTFASWYQIESVSADATTVPIGRALANTTLYVLDEQMNPVPVGVPGELYIGGDGLARGYLNRAELSAKRFVANPFASKSALYRTGDKVRYRNDGAIEFMGRFDHQIKLRGFRIELGEIETALINQEALRDAVAIVREDEPGDKRIAAYLVPSPEWVEQISSNQSGEHVDEWQALYEETYGNIDAAQDLTSNFTGWNSSYTGEPIALPEMEEWLEATVARIGALQPKRVLEIGCGTGLLLYRLAPACERYVGTDFSAVAQQHVRDVVTARDDYQHVELWHRMADDFSDVEAGDFDTVIINSVTQYLPSMDYLADVIEGAVAAIGDSGRIMLGDVRSLPLLKSYHTSVQLYLSPDDADSGELLRNIQQHVEEENELVIEPAFFHALKQRIPRLSHVEVLLKQGQYHNELTGYRYDVVLHVEAPAAELPEAGQWLDWGVSELNAARLQDRLSETGQEWLGISAIPNARIAHYVAVLEQLQGDGGAQSVGELKQSAESAMPRPVEPDELWRLAEAAGYQLELSYTGAGTDGRMDALFRRSGREDCAGTVFWPQQQEVPERPWSAYGSNPLKGRLGNELIPLLRQDLQQHLPEYMLPSVYVVLDALPLNPNGKIDRKALPVPGDVRASLGAEYTAPRTELGQRLAEIWAEVLKLERVGIHDNFFDLGGHSLMATQVVSRIRGQLNVELPLSEMFGYPTVAELAPVVESLMDESDGEETDVIPAVDREGNLPLSFAQERLWFLDQLEPGSTAYNMRLSLRLKGKLQIDALIASLNTIVGRHEALHTHFTMHQGKPIQIIEDVAIELPQEDLSSLPPEALEREVKARVDEEALQPFDLSTGPLLRGRLLRLSDHEHVLLLTMHHIISDGWSLGVLFRELGECYIAFSHGEQPVLAKLAVQYADFSVWQRQWLSGEQLDKQLDYWGKQLAGLQVLDLPTDRTRPALQTYDGALEVLSIDKQLSDKLERLSKDSGVTLFMTLLAVYMVMLHRYSGQDDIVIGSPIANRNRSELEGLIAFFVNMLVMRVDCSGNPDFRTLVKRVNEMALGAYEHQDIPFERLINVLQVERDPSRNPLFQVHFALQDAPLEALELRGLTIEPVVTEIQFSRFDLECHVSNKAEGLQVGFVYNTNLFEVATIQRMRKHFANLLTAVVVEPDKPIDLLPMLSREERHLLLEQWNQTVTDYPRTQTVHELFEQQASESPDSIAVEYEGQTLSYTQLNKRADQLAHYLQARGVGPEVIVGLFIERSLEMIVGLLGILKAGGAYLPLDPEYPQSRITFMLEDAGVPVLLSLSSLSEQLPDFAGELVCLDSDWVRIEKESADNPVPSATADNLAYVIYTSGSTGIPKGVEIPHRAINRLVRNTDYYQVDATDRIAQASNVSFDAATFEIWGALLNGAQLIGINKEVLLNSKSLTAFLQEQGISAMFLTTALFNQIAREAPDAFKGLRGLMFGGEAVDPGAVRQVMASHPPERLLHVYGPTESTTFASWYPIENVAIDASTVPIGRPLANTTLYVLDQNKNPVPVGVPGELYIGGDGLARGYLNRPELTAERFVPDPRHPESTLYRTGDKVRYCRNGAIEYLGRFDHQVKLRGFRVELGEIESVLLSQPVVSDAVVIVHEDEPGDKRLVAYVAADSSEAPSESDLRDFVVKSLPNYMVPSAFMVLEKLPLTANSKVDRNALPLPGDVWTSQGAEYTAPRTELEQQLAGIWSEVLKLERVGVHDNFFDLGGHSLMATQVVSRIRGQLNVELPLSEMFGYPTVAELVPGVESLLDERGEEEADVIPVIDREGDLPLSFAQERLWFLDQLEPGGTAYNMPLAIRLKGKLRVDALLASLNTIVDRHEALRTHFPAHQGKPIQVVDEATFELAQDDLSALSSEMLEDEVKARINAEALQPFDLSTGPLLRGRLLRLSDHEHVLLLTMHHIISDGWSLGVLFRELGACYAAYSEGKQSLLAELPIQYADFAVWQREWLSGEVLASQMTYWQENLSDLTTLDLPTDRPRPAVRTYNGAFETLKLDTKLGEQLEMLSKRAGVTPFMTLLAGFAVLMHRYCGQDDIVIGSPIANRNRSELEELIGFFINMQVLRLDVSGNPDFRTLLGQVQKTTLGAYQHQDIPFEKLVEVLQPERDRSRNPLFQVQFALQNAPIEPLQLNGLKLEPANSGVRSTRFDLECHLWPRDSGLEAVFVYNTDLFDAATIKTLLGHYQTLLAGIVADPDRCISELPMLSRREHQQFENWNLTSTEYPADKTVSELFEIQAAATPDAIAVDYQGGTLSYAQLNQRANQVGHYLQARGVGADVAVGICVERSLEMVVGLLGIVKAGGAYVPLDPDYPKSRLGYMLEDAQVPVLLTMSPLRNLLPDFDGALVCLDTDWTMIERESTENPVSNATADNLIYVIYTSGSTGRPKGTLIEHRSAVRLVKETNYVELGPDEVFLQFAPISFDASTFELWGSLLNGAKLVLYPAGPSSLEALGRTIHDKGITTLWLTSALFSQMVDNHLPSLSGVRQLLAGGEALSLPHVQKVLEQLGDRRLINGYGPTENTTFTCCHVMTSSSDAEQSVPIGRPISNTTVYILDKQMRPVPIGVPGELYIGGDGLARGYLNRPELTAKKFVADPFSEDQSAHLYRTGDKVRYRRDGAIEFLGRFDHQVKIRGFRVELGEIESVLLSQPVVSDAVVIVHEDEPGDKRLVAYVAVDSSEAPSESDLRDFVVKSLPNYMVPSAFMVLEKLPLTANGKVDRKALPLPGDVRASLVAEYTAPRTELEQQLAQIWEGVLKLERVGIHDNFFDLGGHSLMATQVVSRIREQLNVELPLSEIFDYPTVAELAQKVELIQWTSREFRGDESDGREVFRI